MNNTLKKALALILSVMMLFGTFAMSASADEVKRIVCTMVEDGTSYTYRVGDAQKNLWGATCTFTTDDGGLR